VSDIVAACIQYPGLDCLIARSHLSHVKASIWNQTLPDVLKHYKGTFKLNHSELIVRFWNGSTISLGGFDDKERIEKQLGLEYAIIYANECSTIAYDAILLAHSSLAQVIPGFKNKMYYDMNPPPPTHWTHRLFIEKIDPKSKNDQVPNPEDYVTIKMNPMDNPNLDQSYIDGLDNLPDRERRRYKYGEFVKLEGAIFDKLDLDTHVIDIEDLPQMEYFTVGSDITGTNFAAILIGWSGESIYILDEFFAHRESITNFNRQLYQAWSQYDYINYCDPAAAQLIDEMWNGIPADNSVQAGLDFLLTKIENNQLFILRKNKIINVPQLISELDSYRYDDKGRIIKENDHGTDSLRYGAYSHARFGGSILLKEKI
jgi:phage terminase large subunit